MQSKLRLALDAGGVLFTHDSGHKEDTSGTAWISGCRQALEKLSAFYDLYVISFAGQQRGLETRKAIATDAKAWLPEDHVYIVNDRKEKGALCAGLGIHIMVDDRLDVLNIVHSAAPQCKLYHFDLSGRKKNKPRYVRTVVNWEDLVDCLVKG